MGGIAILMPRVSHPEMINLMFDSLHARIHRWNRDTTSILFSYLFTNKMSL